MTDDYTTPVKQGETIVWTKDFKCPEDAIIIRKGVPTDIQNEDRFSPINTFAFNPLAQDLFSLDNGVLALILLKLTKDKPALATNLIQQYMKNVTDLLSDIIASGKTSPLASINASTTFAVVAHRFGIITDSGYLKIADQTRSIIDKLVQLSAAEIAASGVFSGLSIFAEGTKTKGTGISKLANLASLK